MVCEVYEEYFNSQCLRDHGIGFIQKLGFSGLTEYKNINEYLAQFKKDAEIVKQTKKEKK